MSTLLLDVKSVSAGYDGKNVIQDISLQVSAGQTYGLIGLNGAGKTTLLKTILDLKKQNSGTIFINGHDAGTSEAKKTIAFLPERFDPAWFLNAYEFINFTLSLYGRKVTREAIDIMADKVGLSKAFLPKKAQAYSKGMRQKLGLITTFMTGCPLLILDEPMSGLDPLARTQIKSIMLEAKEQGRTIFLSSHILSDMEEMCDQVSVLDRGNICFQGSPQELLGSTNQPHLERAFLSLIGENRAQAA